jgi:hypothetical protein
MNYLTEVWNQEKENQKIFDFWIKLNHAPFELYKRFHKIYALRNNGKHIRGVNIEFGKVTLNIE